MKTCLLSSIACLFLMSSCEQTENLALPEPSIYNNWEEIEPEGIGQFEGSTYTSLQLMEDNTFHLTYKTWTDMKRIGDPCPVTQELYAKGTYTASNETLILVGCYTDSMFDACLAKCDGQIEFREVYNYQLTPDNLILNPGEDLLIRRYMIAR